MKKILPGIFTLLLVSSCHLMIVEEFPYDDRDNFTGRFEAEEYSETYDGFTYYDVTILRDSDHNSSVIYLRNFYGLGFEVYAEVYGDKLTIPRQRINDIIIQGTGRLDYDDILLTYSIDSRQSGNRYVEFCNTVYVRR